MIMFGYLDFFFFWTVPSIFWVVPLFVCVVFFFFQGRLDIGPLLAIPARPPPVFELPRGIRGVGLRAGRVFRRRRRWRWRQGVGGHGERGRFMGSRGTFVCLLASLVS